MNRTVKSYFTGNKTTRSIIAGLQQLLDELGKHEADKLNEAKAKRDAAAALLNEAACAEFDAANAAQTANKISEIIGDA